MSDTTIDQDAGAPVEEAGAEPEQSAVSAEDTTEAVSDEKAAEVSGVRAPVKKTLLGRVVSDKMQKTIVVLVTERKVHRLYRKYMTRTKKVKAHDEDNVAHEGDTVRVVESRPLSKDKRWVLSEVVERAR